MSTPQTYTCPCGQCTITVQTIVRVVKKPVKAGKSKENET